jgi:hypothetical protein
VSAILMDLSKAFDCLPHDILLSKLAAYGLSSQSVKLLENYLTGRKQQIKLQGVVSGWQILQKGVPQGSSSQLTEKNVMWQTIKSFLKIHQNSCHITIPVES